MNYRVVQVIVGAGIIALLCGAVVLYLADEKGTPRTDSRLSENSDRQDTTATPKAVPSPDQVLPQTKSVGQNAAEGAANNQTKTANVRVDDTPIDRDATTTSKAKSGGRQDGQRINPYYAKRQWHVWSVDQPDGKKLPAEFELTVPSKRVFPDGDSFLSYSSEPSAYAGCWDDVYVSQDNFHSVIAKQWNDDDGHVFKLDGQIPRLKRGTFSFGIRGNQILSPDSAELRLVGANFTSQSTTGMGHDIANNGIQMLVNEREFYFANVLRCGPAHVSFRELSLDESTDEYQALVPCMFNSIGSSMSESWAMGKMVIAGAHLRAEVKQAAKLHGIYPATLLLLWKAGLPYEERFGHELRHRVAYCGDGIDREKRATLQASAAMLPHTYDDTDHLLRMVDIAKSLTVAPPVSVIRMGAVNGGKLVYGGKTTALITQSTDDVILRFSAVESFDIQGLPINVDVTQLYGTPGAEVRRLNNNEFEITVPFRANMPRGRSSFAVIANNGHVDGNPAIVNVFRSLGTVNLRPVFRISEEFVVVPGKKAEFEIKVSDPEGFEVSLHKHVHTRGDLQGKRFVWDCPADQTDGDYPVTIIASDGCTGSSYSAVKLPLKVRTVLATMAADSTDGKVPLEVNFSATGSRDTQSRPVNYRWDFGDGKPSTDMNPTHVFTDPGFHKVRLTVSAGASLDTKEVVIHARHNWKNVIDNGWSEKGVSASVWNVHPDLTAKPGKFGSQKTIQVTVAKRSHLRKPVESKLAIKTPCFVEAEFYRGNKTSGVGIEMFGAVFGCGLLADGKMFADDLSFSDKDGHVLVGDFPTNPANLSSLRVYVTADSANPGRFVFSGVLNCDNGESFFRIGNRSLATDRVSILGGELGSQHFTRFQVCSP
ncbi:MAG: PKD domain-containing protein [Rubripirellula sp.]